MSDNLDLENNKAPIVDNPWDNDDWVAKIERYKQQIEWSRQEALIQRQERISDWNDALSADVNNLVRLKNVKDTKLVSEVLAKFNYSSIEEALEENWLTEKKPGSQEWMTKEQLEKWYEDRKAQDIHSIAMQEAQKSFSDLTNEEQEIAKKNFEKITKWKTLTLDDAREYADMAALYATKDKIIKKSDWLIDLSWSWFRSNPNIKWKDAIDSILENW